MCLSRVRLSPIATRDQASDIVPRPGSEDQGHWRQDALCQAAAAQDEVDERPACPAVAVGKGMDGLELGVCERGLRAGSKRPPVRIGARPAGARGAKIVI